MVPNHSSFERQEIYEEAKPYLCYPHSKKNHVIKLVDFRPIILCNVLYKLISKIIADRLKVLLPHIILETQSSFVPRKKIADNILIAYKILHFLKMKK